MPGPDILRLFRAHGGEHATIGSDTHMMSTFGTNIDVAVRTLREAGWTTASHIENGRLVAVPLERIIASLRPATPALA
jgi:histidinol phosphatase-like PHP family hydrolase